MLNACSIRQACAGETIYRCRDESLLQLLTATCSLLIATNGAETKAARLVQVGPLLVLYLAQYVVVCRVLLRLKIQAHIDCMLLLLHLLLE